MTGAGLQVGPALDRGRRDRIRFNQIQLGIKRAFVLMCAVVPELEVEAVPDHVEDEPTWPTEVTPLER